MQQQQQPNQYGQAPPQGQYQQQYQGQYQQQAPPQGQYQQQAPQGQYQQQAPQGQYQQQQYQGQYQQQPPQGQYQQQAPPQGQYQQQAPQGQYQQQQYQGQYQQQPPQGQYYQQQAPPQGQYQQKPPQGQYQQQQYGQAPQQAPPQGQYQNHPMQQKPYQPPQGNQYQPQQYGQPPMQGQHPPMGQSPAPLGQAPPKRRPLTFRKKMKDVGEPAEAEALEKMANVTGVRWRTDIDWDALLANEYVDAEKLPGQVLGRYIKTFAEGIEKACQDETIKNSLVQAASQHIIKFTLDKDLKKYSTMSIQDGCVIINVRCKSKSWVVNLYEMKSVKNIQGMVNSTDTGDGALPLDVQLNIRDKSEPLRKEAILMLYEATGLDWQVLVDVKHLIAKIQGHMHGSNMNRAISKCAEIAMQYCKIVATKIKKACEDEIIRDEICSVSAHNPVMVFEYNPENKGKTKGKRGSVSKGSKTPYHYCGVQLRPDGSWLVEVIMWNTNKTTICTGKNSIDKILS